MQLLLYMHVHKLKVISHHHHHHHHNQKITHHAEWYGGCQ